MNTNLVHNILNVATWILGLLALVLIYSGCTALPNGNFDCSSSDVIPPQLLPYILLLTTGMAVAKTVINLVRDGPSGLFKIQPPVTDKTAQVTIAAKEDTTITVEQTKPTVRTNVSQKARGGASPETVQKKS